MKFVRAKFGERIQQLMDGARPVRERVNVARVTNERYVAEFIDSAPRCAPSTSGKICCGAPAGIEWQPMHGYRPVTQQRLESDER